MRTPDSFSLCDKHRKTREILPGDLVSALVSACTGKGSEDPMVLAKARKVLKNARDCNLWFACDCMATEKALMHPRLINGGYSLVRNANSHHAKGCVFEPGNTSETPAVPAQPDTKGSSEAVPLARKPFEGTWLTGKELDAVVVARKESNVDSEKASSGSGRALDGLTRRLISALEWMGLCAVSSNDLMQDKQNRWLVHGKDSGSLKKLDAMPMGYGFTWQEVGCTDLGELAALRKRLVSQKPRFGKHAMEGFMLCPLTEVRLKEKGDGVLVNTRHNHDFTGAVQGRIALPGFSRGGEDAYLCLARLRETKGLDYIPLIGASVLPVVSAHIWMPVESGLERDTFKELLSVLRWYRDRSSGNDATPVIVEKPLNDLESPDGFCRPDFMVRLPNGKRVVIECMGMNDESYRERKLRTNASMHALPGVIALVERHPNTPDGSLKDQLCKLIRDNRCA